MFKRDLFDITDEEVPGPREAGEQFTGERSGAPPAGAGGNRNGGSPATSQAGAPPPRRSPDRNSAAALIAGLVALLLAIVALILRPVGSPPPNSSVAPHSNDRDRENAVEPKSETAKSSLRSPVRQPEQPDMDRPVVRRRAHSATSRPAPLQHGTPLPESTPGSAISVPIAPPRPEPPRAGEFSFEVGYR
jgi:hypothetical protein